MSTRCQTRVIGGQNEDNGQFSEDVTLYHHSDGMPENMVPLFWKAYQFGITPYTPEWYKDNLNAQPSDVNQWQAFRAGYAASFLCHVDPRGFWPESGHELHPDIAWYYKLYVSGKKVKGQKYRQWKLEIFKATCRMKYEPKLKKVMKRIPLCDLVDDAGQLKADVLAEIKKQIG